MPVLLALLGYALNAICLVHAINTRQQQFWFMVLAMAPGVGSAAYFLMVVWPDIQRSRAARGVAGVIARTLDPDRDLKDGIEALEVTDTVENKRMLARQLAARGNYDDAIQLYRSAAVGLHQDDPVLLIGLAEALAGKGDHAGVLECLDRLFAKHPNLQSRDGHMLYAKSLEALGRIAEAAAEYRALSSYAVGPEAAVRFGLLAQTLGHHAEAQQVLSDIVRRYRRRGVVVAPEDREWVERAASALGG
jgi:hypothetical protein